MSTTVPVVLVMAE
jgi:hypothetical protein